MSCSTPKLCAKYVTECKSCYNRPAGRPDMTPAPDEKQPENVNRRERRKQKKQG